VAYFHPNCKARTTWKSRFQSLKRDVAYFHSWT